MAKEEGCGQQRKNSISKTVITKLIKTKFLTEEMMKVVRGIDRRNDRNKEVPLDIFTELPGEDMASLLVILASAEAYNYDSNCFGMLM